MRTQYQSGAYMGGGGTHSPDVSVAGYEGAVNVNAELLGDWPKAARASGGTALGGLLRNFLG